MIITIIQIKILTLIVIITNMIMILNIIIIMIIIDVSALPGAASDGLREQRALRRPPAQHPFITIITPAIST